MRVVGIIFVLAAAAAIQLPWFSCHSDCQHAFLPVWELGVHPCHDEAAHVQDENACPCCPAHVSERGADPEAGGEDPGHDHGPGDHELQLQTSRRPLPTQTTAPDLTPAAFVVLLPAAGETQDPVATCYVLPGSFDTGPPGRIASVRLLL